MPSGHRGDGYTGNRGIATGERGRRGLDMIELRGSAN